MAARSASRCVLRATHSCCSVQRARRHLSLLAAALNPSSEPARQNQAGSGTGSAPGGGSLGARQRKGGAAGGRGRAAASGGVKDGGASAGAGASALAARSVAVEVQAPPAAAAEEAVMVGGEADEAELLWDEAGDSVLGAAANNIVSAAPLLGGSPAGAASGARRRCYRCLVLDSSYRPINTISWFKAVVMGEGEKVDVLDYYPNAYAISAYRTHPLPAVLRAHRYVDIHDIAGRVNLTRRNVFTRDRYCCQYCGSNKDLTLDHVTPVSKGGRNSWTNLVTACSNCNQRKGSHLLAQLGWRLRTPPREPSPLEVGVVMGVAQSDIDNPPEQWAPYLAPYKDKINKLKLRRVAGA